MGMWLTLPTASSHSLVKTLLPLLKSSLLACGILNQTQCIVTTRSQQQHSSFACLVPSSQITSVIKFIAVEMQSSSQDMDAVLLAFEGNGTVATVLLSVRLY